MISSQIKKRFGWLAKALLKEKFYRYRLGEPTIIFQAATPE
jgi:hypothetical protein